MILSPNRSHFGGPCAARTSTLATLRGSIERIETHGDACTPGRVALGHADADATLQGGLALGAMHEVFTDAGRQSAAATGFVAGLAGRVAARRPLVWVRQDFTEIESGALLMSGLAELGLDPRLLVTVRAADVDRRVADRRRCARLRCARRRRAGSLGASAAARSRRQPQADAGGAGLGRHRAVVAAGGGATALDSGDKMDRARGAFAAGRTFNACGGLEHMGRAGVRRAACPQPSWPCWAVDHGMEM